MASIKPGWFNAWSWDASQQHGMSKAVLTENTMHVAWTADGLDPAIAAEAGMNRILDAGFGLE